MTYFTLSQSRRLCQEVAALDPNIRAAHDFDKLTAPIIATPEAMVNFADFLVEIGNQGEKLKKG